MIGQGRGGNTGRDKKITKALSKMIWKPTTENVYAHHGGGSLKWLVTLYTQSGSRE